MPFVGATPVQSQKPKCGGGDADATISTSISNQKSAFSGASDKRQKLWELLNTRSTDSSTAFHVVVIPPLPPLLEKPEGMPETKSSSNG